MSDLIVLQKRAARGARALHPEGGKPGLPAVVRLLQQDRHHHLLPQEVRERALGPAEVSTLVLGRSLVGHVTARTTVAQHLSQRACPVIYFGECTSVLGRIAFISRVAKRVTLPSSFLLSLSLWTAPETLRPRNPPPLNTWCPALVSVLLL